MRRCVKYFHDPDMTLFFDLKVKFIGFLTCFRVRPKTFFLDWHWLTIFGTWVYHHKTMCQVLSWSRFHFDLWAQGQIYRLLLCLRVRSVTSVTLTLAYHIWHISISPWGIWSSTFMILIQPWPLTKVKFIGFLRWLCVQASAFLSFDIVYHHGTMCRIHSWTLYDLDLWPQYHSPWIWVWQNVLALWHRHTKFWHMGVSPWDNMLCTFLTLVWPWPLTYMWVVGGILSQFY